MSSLKMRLLGFMGKRCFIVDFLVGALTWFSNLGIDDMYFKLESIETIANHIMALYGAKV